MTKEDSEKKTTPKEDSEKPKGTKPKVVVEKQQTLPATSPPNSPPTSSPTSPPTRPPTSPPASPPTTHIAARLDEAVLKGAKSDVNRSSDLVPLSQDFDQMRKKLRSLIAAAKQYRAARVQLDKTRMEVRTL
jgi:hypothetical protein